jgi:type III pantothenate kinase
MSVTICFDFGNTRKKAAIFNDKELSQTMVLEDDAITTVQKLLDTHKPEKTILSSVINHHTEIETLLTEKTRFHLLNSKSKLPFTTPIAKPETIGADRLAMASGGVGFYPDKNLLIIGLGTCITLNFVNKYKEWMGGSISPGLEMRLKSLQYYTAKLPLVKPKADVPLIGYDTDTNI